VECLWVTSVVTSGAAQSSGIVSCHGMSSAFQSELIVSYICLINPFNKFNLLTGLVVLVLSQCREYTLTDFTADVERVIAYLF
jgi:hypothetical protein